MANKGFAAMVAARAKSKSGKKGAPPEGSPEEEAQDAKEDISKEAIQRRLKGGRIGY